MMRRRVIQKNMVVISCTASTVVRLEVSIQEAEVRHLAGERLPCTEDTCSRTLRVDGPLFSRSDRTEEGICADTGSDVTPSSHCVQVKGHVPQT